jgi:hypothetical protein
MLKSRQSLFVNVVLISIAFLSLIVFVIDRQVSNTVLPQNEIFDQSQILTVKVGGPQSATYTVQQYEAINALDLLRKLQTENSAFTFATEAFATGEFVTTINGVVADKTKEFWEIKVNGEPAQVGISELQLKTTDTLEFNLVGFN